MLIGRSLAGAAELTSDGILVTAAEPMDDAGPTITCVNAAFTEMTGYAPAEAVGKPLGFLVGPDAAQEGGQEGEKPFWQGLGQGAGRPLRVELRLRRRDGHPFWVDFSLHPVLDAAGRCTGFLGFMHDITALKRSGEEWRRREEFLRLVTDAVPAMIGYVDRNLLHRFANARYREWAGRHDGDLIGRHVSEVLGAKSYAAIQDRLAAALAGQEVSFEWTCPLAEGGDRYVQSYCIPDRTPEGEVDGLVVLALDLSDRKRAEDRIAESERRLQNAQRIAGVGWWELDPRTWAATWSENVYAIWGRDARSFQPTLATFLDTVVPEDRDTLRDAMAFDWRWISLEYRIRRPDGEIRHIFSEASADHDGQGRLIRCFGVVRDVTDLKRATEALRRAKEEAEEANHAKSRFLAAASHDLRQPLNAMSLLLGVLRPRVAGDPRALDVADRLRASLDAMMELFNALLDISKFETGAVEVRRGPVPVATLFDHLETDFASTARAKGLKLRIRRCDIGLWSDSTLLERILRNLVSNAIRYTAKGGVLVACRRRGGEVRIDVCDTGPGIPEDQRQVIFEEFHQIRNPARRRQDGYGLGLAIVKRAAALLGHRLELASVVGRGSCFTVWVPLADGQEACGDAAPTGTNRAPGTCTALVIEDDPLVATAMRLTLEDFGCAVATAATGTEALRLAESLPVPPQLVVADYRLPGDVNGIEAITRLRDRLGWELPAVVVTGDLAPDIQARARRIGVACLTKPVKPEDLGAVIRQARNAAA